MTRPALLLALAASGCISRVPSTATPADPADIAPANGWVAVQGITPIHQKEILDCGPAALAMVAARWGVDIDPSAVRRPRTRGATLGQLRAAARREGLTAYAIQADQRILIHELDQGRPILVGLLRGKGRKRVSHFEVVIAYHPRQGKVATIDPSAGFAVRAWKDLQSEWAPAGRPALVVLGPLSTGNR
jgi:ABC-type bacteriocin/lantibiotic exporter with double-glycine peptidase domain